MHTDLLIVSALTNVDTYVTERRSERDRLIGDLEPVAYMTDGLHVTYANVPLEVLTVNLAENARRMVCQRRQQRRNPMPAL